MIRQGTHRWRRAFLDQRCGKLGCLIRKGDPVLEVTFHGGRMVRVRCRACAETSFDEAVPADLPPLKPVVPVSARPMLKIATDANALPLDFKRFSAAALPIDFKAAAAGREPGEDG